MKYLNALISTYFFLIFCSSAYASGIEAELCASSDNTENIYYVSTTGNDYGGTGSRLKPWRNIEFAISQAKESSTIIVKPGIYTGSTRIKKEFNKKLLIKSQLPYLAKLTHSSRVLAIVGSAKNITIEGFEITHNAKKVSPVLVHIDGYGSYGTKKTVSNITLRNNIIHDSYNNDLLKINNGAKDIKVQCNIFYNQGDSDEHIDVNSVKDISISDNIFLNDFLVSNREISKKSSSFIVVKDSNAHEDDLIGSLNVNIHRNIFLNWQGSHGQGFILIGEDGKPYFEAQNINIYNNLMLGNSPLSMRSPLMIKGAKDINFYNNTITGDLPSNAYVIRITKERQNLKPTNINLYNNIWSDNTGTMGQGEFEPNSDFSDTLIYNLNHFTLDNNLYWNGSKKIPSSIFDKINYQDDPNRSVINPLLNDHETLKIPTWNTNKQVFSDGSLSIREAFKKLVYFYAIPRQRNHIINKQEKINSFPQKDILNKQRTPPHSLGAFSVK